MAMQGEDRDVLNPNLPISSDIEATSGEEVLDGFFVTHWNLHIDERVASIVQSNVYVQKGVVD